MFDNKATLIFNHYKQILEGRTFDEYDILGFLIFMRSYLQRKTYPHIYNFADLVAHRNRDRGIVMDNIKITNDNLYTITEGQKSIEGYQGIDYSVWKQEWIELGRQFNIAFTDSIIVEVTVCIFSLAQYSEYKNDDYQGKVVLFQSEVGELALCTTEGKMSSIFVCFAKCGPFKKMDLSFPGGYIKEVVETYRENGTLHLRTHNTIII